MDVSIIIVSWNVSKLLRRCLESLYKTKQNVRFEIFVIDNNSRDGTAKMVRKEFPGVQLIANNENKGFAAACNQGIRRANGKFILLLNPDSEMTDQAMTNLYNFMLKKPSVGVVGSRIVNGDGSIQPSVRRFPTLFSQAMIMLKLHRIFYQLKTLRLYFCRDKNYEKTEVVDQVMGASFMISRSVLKKIGLFDERFFIWFEEVDFCRRAQRAGLFVYYYAGATIIHQQAKSFVQVPPIVKQYLFIRSLLYYFLKHKSFSEYLLLLLLFPASLLLAGIVQIATNFGRNKVYGAA